MTIKTVVVAVLCGAALSGCVQNYATRSVAQGTPPGILTISNAPPTARVIVDGDDLGSVSQLANGASLEPGRHDVVIVVDGRRLHAQAVVVAPGTRVEVRVQ